MKKGSVTDGLVYHAGFPNAAEDHRSGSLSLDSLVVQHRASTFFWKIEEPIEELGWRAGTIVVVDRAVQPHEGDFVVVVIGGAFVVRKLHIKGVLPELLQLDGTQEPDDDVTLWGVVTYVVQGMRA